MENQATYENHVLFNGKIGHCDKSPNILTNVSTKPDTVKHIRVTLAGKVKLIPIEDVFYLKAGDRYVLIKHKKGESLSSETLKKFEKKLGYAFIRIHRNALVARNQISGYEKSALNAFDITLKDIDDHLSISRQHMSEVKKFVNSIAY